MDEKARQIIQSQIAKLPPNVQQAIIGADLPKKMRLLAEKHHLRVDEAHTLENEVMLVMIGLEHPDAFVGNLSRELRLPREAANVIAEDVNNEIFLSIRRALVEMHAPSSQQSVVSSQKDAPPESKEDILKAIEDEPTETTVSNPQSIVRETHPMPQAPQNLPVIEPAGGILPTAITSSPATTKSLDVGRPEITKTLVNPIAAKLAQTTHIPHEQVSTSLPPLVKKALVDPYKEPIG